MSARRSLPVGTRSSWSGVGRRLPGDPSDARSSDCRCTGMVSAMMRRATLAEAVRIARANGNHLAAMHASGGLAAIEYERGDLVSAGARAAESLALAEEHDLGEHWASSLSLAVRGQLLARDDSLDAAERSLVRATELARRGVASIEIGYSLRQPRRCSPAPGHGRRCAADLRRSLRRGRHLCRSGHPALAPDPRRVAPEGSTGSARRSRQRAPDDALSDAELSVLRLLRSELSQREIGGELHLSFNTIKTPRAEHLPQARRGDSCRRHRPRARLELI